MSNKYCIIMAGGVGSRFWPKSRKSMPKQFLDILSTGTSLLRHTFERFSKQVPAENFIVVTNKEYRHLVQAHLPELNDSQILGEPIGRNTAPCIAYAAYSLLKKDPEAMMIVTPADHYVSEVDTFNDIIEECCTFAQSHDALLTIGIKPTRPETGYGYIQSTNIETISPVKCFTEKPSLEVAQTLLQCGEFLWNSGIFIWRVSEIVKAFKEHLPEHHTLFSSIAESYGSEREAEAIAKVFSECKAISIDYGIMERSESVYVRCGEFGWSDVGTWGSVYQLSRKDRYANSAPEGSILTQSRGNIVSLPEGKVAAISGLKDYIVIDTPDVLMVCPMSEEQNIKQFIDELQYQSGEKFI